MPRLRRVSSSSPGFTRRRCGKGWTYLDTAGERITDPAVVERIAKLAIPPAYTDVWICPHPDGHLQAVGTDERGRRQYRYHEQWRLERDRAKHDRVLEVAAQLPRAREVVAGHLRLPGVPRERVLAAAFRLLDLGFFRVGGDTYAEENGSYGLATLKREHVVQHGGELVFRYVAKSGKDRTTVIADPDVVEVVRTLKRRRGGGDDLLAWKDGPRWHDVTSDDVNAYLHETIGPDVSAKDFRTWHATVLAAVALGVSLPACTTPTARKRAVARAVAEVAEYLGNTPAVCRSSYVDPRVVDLFDDGVTIAPALQGLGEDAALGHPATHGAVERAVLDLLHTDPVAVSRAAARGRRLPVRSRRLSTPGGPGAPGDPGAPVAA
ncbi:DNA topoisomerase IB [Paenibacillus sp. TRM 82003]|uniref:DNA topoisomerase IB n=1 Tax=Kineococcus sp. TRM81007 TaxID=2925831 RepID=UPI001F5766BA|nr:DNA topoisomerase IB [Kineococcus sp. TRM81007]MCI2237495.1 DNA topoisomerase IB [Kineococcus sp. TRM81007]MCI3919848.1 DNA topoisomerase IB [Paenibacillus sp. TRM 82003]